MLIVRYERLLTIYRRVSSKVKSGLIPDSPAAPAIQLAEDLMENRGRRVYGCACELSVLS